MTPHNKANLGDIAKTVIMPGDPLRSKYIAEHYLENAKLINDVRGILGYTGFYKGKEITIFASGMGMASMGIYCYELYKFYGVENIIRVGSCGGYKKDLNLFDVILVNQTYTEGNLAYEFNNTPCHLIEADPSLNSTITQTSQEKNMPIVIGNTLCSDCFDVYVDDKETFMGRFPQELNIIGAEMEAFALFYMAKYLGKKAACLLSVVDLPSGEIQATPQERETALNSMIELALESAMKI